MRVTVHGAILYQHKIFAQLNIALIGDGAVVSQLTVKGTSGNDTLVNNIVKGTATDFTVSVDIDLADKRAALDFSIFGINKHAIGKCASV